MLKINRTRRGSAPLEFAMCLPILLVLFVALVWLGMALLAQFKVTVASRSAAWQRRHIGNPDDAFRLEPLTGRISEPRTQRVGLSGVFDSFGDATAKHTILSGSWDFSVLSLPKPPNWQTSRKLVSAHMTGNPYHGLVSIVLSNLLVQGQLALENSLAEVKKLFENWNNEIRGKLLEQFSQFRDKIQGVIDAVQRERKRWEKDKYNPVDQGIAKVLEEIENGLESLRDMIPEPSPDANSDAKPY